MSASSSSSIVRFGRFEVNLQSGELRHAGRKVKLQEQPFQVLATLLERPGELVSREELRKKLWPEKNYSPTIPRDPLKCVDSTGKIY
jgi:DNA-binding winged helix-turn-helix (wHTH) protein